MTPLGRSASGHAAPTVTWIVNTWFAPAARPVMFAHVTACKTAEQPVELAGGTIAAAAGRVSLTWNPPTLSDGPPL